MGTSKANAVLSGSGGQKTFVIQPGSTTTITDFGGVGTGVNPSAAVIAEVDTLKFEGGGLTEQYMLLTQQGSDLLITFDGAENTQVILKNFDLEDLDNLQTSTGASVNIGNIIFTGQSEIQDSFDVIDATQQNLNLVFNPETVTFLNDLDNTAQGRDSRDVIHGQGSNDFLDGEDGDDTLYGEAGSDTLNGGAGDDTLLGDIGDDFLNGGAGSDTLEGGAGDFDNLNGGAGDDSLNGGGGLHDDANYYDAPAKVTVNLATGTASGGAGNDLLSNLEDASGSAFNDTLIGDAGNNILVGYSGDDSLDGGTGNDELYGYLGDDSLDGGTGNDRLTGAAGNDSLYSYSGDDLLEGGAGNDTLDGGTGNDQFNDSAGNDSLNGGDGLHDSVNYYDAPAKITVNLATGTASGGAGNDLLSNLEHVFGSAFNDTLIGDAGNNILEGRAGSDLLEGGAGNDRLNGNLFSYPGDDILEGGVGNDQFVYDTLEDFRAGSFGSDVVRDFTHDIDEIVLDKTTFTRISSDPGEGFSHLGEFTVVSSGVATSNALIVYNSVSGQVFYNENGSAAGFGSGGQFTTLAGAPTLSGSDFIIQA